MENEPLQEAIGEKPPELPSSVFDYWSMAIEARRKQLSDFNKMTDEEKTEHIRKHQALLGQ